MYLDQIYTKNLMPETGEVTMKYKMQYQHHKSIQQVQQSIDYFSAESI